jgi:hypothetical protein
MKLFIHQTHFSRFLIKLVFFPIENFWKRFKIYNKPRVLNKKTFKTHIIIFFFFIINIFVLYESFFCLALAGQGHQDCSMCHKVHGAKDIALFPEPIKNPIINPHTGKKMDKIDALCMKCHANPPYGKGIKEIDPNNKHPFGIKPVLVDLPDQADGFGGQTERLACMGCHDPHPSNRNLGYLRAPSEIKISKTKDVIKSCLWCHPNMKTVFDFLPKKRSKPIKKKKKKKSTKPSSSVGGVAF